LALANAGRQYGATLRNGNDKTEVGQTRKNTEVIFLYIDKLHDKSKSSRRYYQQGDGGVYD